MCLFFLRPRSFIPAPLGDLTMIVGATCNISETLFSVWGSGGGGDDYVVWWCVVHGGVVMMTMWCSGGVVVLS